jgi:prepilin-type N-terminal cleavage/methylation domain-containing protein
MLGRRLRDQRGFTLIELLVTLLIISGGMAATAALVVGANATTSSTQAREAGTALAREVVETSRSVPYARLNQNTVDDELRSRNGLSDSSATDSGWQIERRGTVFTVNVVACSVDDPRDGIGQHAASAFCSDPAQTSPADSVPDDYKRVTSTVSWKPQGKPERSVRQTAIVTNPTSNAGPQITGLSRSPTADPISSDSTTSISFTATTSIKPAAVRWTVDGVLKSTDVPTATTSTYTWPIDSGGTYVVDGTYVVGATAVNEQGQPGTTRSIAVRLDRGRPVAVDGLTGGWNARISKPELEWRTNPESDVVGYRVYRKPLLGSPSVACETPAGKTECIDESPPEGTTIDYYVVALDKDVSSGANREGAPSGIKTVTRTLNQPRPPGELTVSSTPEGPRLAWAPAADPLLPYTGSERLFYRIYRDGELVSNRIDRTGDALELAFTDTDPAAAAGSHAYRVSTVDSRYSESPLLGPVSP